MTIDYYIGIAVGIGCVLIAYVISKLVKKRVNHFFCVIPDRGITANLNT